MYMLSVSTTVNLPPAARQTIPTSHVSCYLAKGLWLHVPMTLEINLARAPACHLDQSSCNPFRIHAGGILKKLTSTAGWDIVVVRVHAARVLRAAEIMYIKIKAGGPSTNAETPHLEFA